ncbi:MAG: L-aspartate oxidase, partial [Candidatus Bathyarchaeota archaeon]
MREVVKTDFLVIGSGIAGLSFAIKASEYGKVTIITKKELMESNTNLAQGGIAAVLDEEDSFESHIDDTLRNGCGLCNREAVETLVKKGPSAIDWLMAQGVEFDKERNKLSLSLESGHSRRRIAHKGDYTGKELEEALVASVRRNGIDVHENCLALDLIVKEKRSYGAEVLNLEEERVMAFISKATILATGGVGQVYAQTSNPYIATGDGVAMAYRAGTKLEDMEFIQFHPTTLQCQGEPNFLISEAVRGEGGKIRNSNGEAFMARYDKAQELASRDIVSRAVFEELKMGQVYLDLRHKEKGFIIERFPMIYKECLRRGIDITKDLIPIVPAAHYLCGGIKVDLQGESSIMGLFAFGECAATGVHGANRLASNSLLESVVFAIIGVNRARSYLNSGYLNSVPEETSLKIEDSNNRRDDIKRDLQDLMWKYVGILRRVDDLNHTISKLRSFEEEIRRINKDGL